jgi:hypothetical protein
MVLGAWLLACLTGVHCIHAWHRAASVGLASQIEEALFQHFNGTNDDYTKQV